jgi:methionine synthase / methylenetetrahydrofolate reductase(NADPH)
MDKSNLQQVLESGRFAVTAELGPPKNADAGIVRKKAALLKGAADAVNITDCQTAIVRMSSIAAGLLAMKEGIEPVIQMTCRDRNRIGIQSDLLGAYALGAKNLLCLTGDHQKFGNHPQSKNVFDLDSMQLLDLVRNLKEKRFQCGEEIEGAEPSFFIGAAENPFADPFEYRALRLAKKAAAGAQFIQTQIIYDVEKFARWMGMVRDLGLDKQLYILGGVTPMKSVGMARYMQKNVPGMDVPEELIQRLKGAKDQTEEAIDITVEIIEQLKDIPGIAGVHIMAIEWEAAVPVIAERAGLLPRP